MSTARKVQPGSATDRLIRLNLGERAYVETTIEAYAKDMRVMSRPRSRRPAELSGRDFAVSLHTSVAAGDPRDVRYLLCIERTA